MSARKSEIAIPSSPINSSLPVVDFQERERSTSRIRNTVISANGSVAASATPRLTPPGGKRRANQEHRALGHKGVQGGSKASRHSGTDAARHRQASGSGTRAARQGDSRPGRIRSVAETCRCCESPGDPVVGNPAALPANFDGDRCRKEHNDCFPLAHRYH